MSGELPEPGAGAGGGAGEGAPCADYLDPYRRVLMRSGAAFESLLWRSRESQQSRFRVLAECVDFGGRTIADLGCGHADLAIWLRTVGIAYTKYIGVDALEAMLACSRSRTAQAGITNAEFVLADFSASEGIFERLAAAGAETFVFSGSLNTHAQRDALRVLSRAWRTVRRLPSGILVFNFLSDGARPGREGRARDAQDEGPAYQFNTRRMLAWALRRTRLVAFRQDYLQGQDATIVMRTRG